VKQENYVLASLKTIKKEPCPRGMTSREIVTRAIEFSSPPRVPYYFLFHPSAADLVFLGPIGVYPAPQPPKSKPGDHYFDEWGVEWTVTGRYWDNATGHPLADLKNLNSYRFPDYAKKIRQIAPLARLGNLAGKYVLGLNPIGMFERIRSLMGFEEMMVAPYTQPDAYHKLLGKLADLTIESIRVYHSIGGFHGFESAEDWGLQNSIQMKIDMFREFYKPYYKKIIDACHELGMHYFWHNCGYIVDMFPDLIELGVDVLQLDQPRLIGHQKLIECLGGKICMWNTVDVQWCVSNDVTDDDIREEVLTMLKTYDPVAQQGGYIAKHYPQPWDIHLSPERQMLIYQAFMDSGFCSLK
jgi:uroporphyrinogen decarboxylase